MPTCALPSLHHRYDGTRCWHGTVTETGSQLDSGCELKEGKEGRVLQRREQGGGSQVVGGWQGARQLPSPSQPSRGPLSPLLFLFLTHAPLD